MSEDNGPPKSLELSFVGELFQEKEKKEGVKSTLDSTCAYCCSSMSRPLRIQYPGAWYHVMNRGRRHEVIFPGGEDYGQFMELLQAGSAMWNVRVAAFCLMPNPYHLLVQTPDANLSWTGALQQRGLPHEAKARE